MNLRYKLNSGKNSKIGYYINNYLHYALPRTIYQRMREGILREFDKASAAEQYYILDRVEYYCKLKGVAQLSEDAKVLADHTKSKFKGYPSAYFFDSYEYTRYYNDDLRWEYLFGDVTRVPEQPSIVKSRPICEANENSVLLNLDKNRHFVTLNDRTKFEDKDNKAIFRGDIYVDNRDMESKDGVVLGKAARLNFVKQYIGHPMCDIGSVGRKDGIPEAWQREPMPLQDHLSHKFIFALEGNDVASNLKWVMSTNSLAVMPRPTCETWFMEGRLVAGEHFVQIAPDFSDVESQLQYYIDHPKESIEMAKNSNQYISQFLNPRRELLISLMVLQRYFECTGQL